ncbi:hypothetical protein WN55_05450 [Dufourea novaeangliae]|uniref:Integrase catalytic domain-containing protein n=1 Tax=Dufourea novaeangliae TaxID=178035 RepID=A0A154P2R9_DUFNO|nr:hypothetical protein WN55_05450 [Dufourea novaeangliae]
MTNNHLQKDIGTLCTDNGLEFLNLTVRSMLESRILQHPQSAAFTPEKNGLFGHWSVVKAIRIMLYTKKLPMKLWVKNVNTAVYLLIRQVRALYLRRFLTNTGWTRKQTDMANRPKVFGSGSLRLIEYRSKGMQVL